MGKPNNDEKKEKNELNLVDYLMAEHSSKAYRSFVFKGRQLYIRNICSGNFPIYNEYMTIFFKRYAQNTKEMGVMNADVLESIGRFEGLIPILKTQLLDENKNLFFKEKDNKLIENLVPTRGSFLYQFAIEIMDIVSEYIREQHIKNIDSFENLKKNDVDSKTTPD